MGVNGETSRTLDEIQEHWLSCHLYYHQDLDRVLRGFVHPLVASLVKAARIEAFFFVRYGLGGPHVRLRLRALPDFRDHVLKEVQRCARDFLDWTPSATSLEEETLRKRNRGILASDPHEIDDAVYPDNSFRWVPFRPEIQRYGGPSRFQASLDFFTLSSVAAIELLARYGDRPRSTQLTHALRLLLHQALGFAADETELLDLLGYGVNWWGEALPQIVEKSGKVAQSQQEGFLQLFRQSRTRVRSLHAEPESFAAASDLLVAGASRLSAAIRTADRVIRAGIGGSQLHMTAARLGLSNAEEVYISRILTETLREARAAGEDLSWLGSPENPGALGDLLLPALAALGEVPTP